MEIQQHDSVVVEAAGISARLRQAQREGEVLRGRGRRHGLECAALPPSCWIKKEETSSPTVRVLKAEVPPVRH